MTGNGLGYETSFFVHFRENGPLVYIYMQIHVQSHLTPTPFLFSWKLLFPLLRASYFTPTPTGKMYAVVAAAKALYEQLGEMGESSIDGDSFLDLWIYVIIKASVKDLVSQIVNAEQTR